MYTEPEDHLGKDQGNVSSPFMQFMNVSGLLGLHHCDHEATIFIINIVGVT